MSNTNNTKKKIDIYGGQDPREMPAYSIPEVAHYLNIPKSTLEDWSLGRKASSKRKELYPIIERPDKNLRLLSFINFVEAYVLSAIRREHNIPMDKVKKALLYLQEEFPSKHPLADQQFETNGLDLFIDRYGQLINISQAGQLAMKDLLKEYLHRIDRDPKGIAIRLYPFTRKPKLDDPKLISIDPYISFGRPVLAGTGIPTAIIAERYKAGETIEGLAKDYGRQREEIEEAIRCEFGSQAA
ncbi:MAG: DUF433 domain-containing protein [Blastocatellia bacterium]